MAPISTEELQRAQARHLRLKKRIRELESSTAEEASVTQTLSIEQLDALRDALKTGKYSEILEGGDAVPTTPAAIEVQKEPQAMVMSDGAGASAGFCEQLWALSAREVRRPS